jgi:predicted enzyme related to lactoylglutathione lyase
MSKRGRYPTGKPCWFEIATADIAAAGSFYRVLLGWDFDESDGTHRALVDKQVVAAIVEARHGRQPNWTVYLATDDVDATVRAVVAAGGTIVEPPEETSGGKRAIAADPTGGAFGLWQGGSFYGSDLLDAPGAVCWTELSSRKPAAAADFFGAVFGAEVKRPFRGYDYVQLRIGGKEAAGILGMTHEKRPNQGVQAWFVYFQVPSTDSAVAAAVAHGGKIIEPAENTPFGRLAIIADPFGARFAVIERGGAKA